MSKMKRLGIAILSAMVAIIITAMPVMAIALPDSTPSVEDVYIYRNVLETGDMAVIIFENTPYGTVPTDYDYSEAFIWRLIDTDNTTELAQAVGYDYNVGTYEGSGYGYNVISFYLDATEVTALGITWLDILTLRLSGNPVAFASPPTYNYPVTIGDYSSLTDTADVKADIALLILTIAGDLDNKWGLTSTYSLISESETGTSLSLFGQAYFRGAIYGVQAMAPAAFPLSISDIVTTARTWTTTYVTELGEQHTGDYIDTALTAGNDFFDVDFGLFGMLLTLGICVVIILGHWYLKGGNVWTGLTESAPVVVIATRMGMFGLGELGLLAAVCWLFVSAKLWRIV